MKKLIYAVLVFVLFSAIGFNFYHTHIAYELSREKINQKSYGYIEFTDKRYEIEEKSPFEGDIQLVKYKNGKKITQYIEYKFNQDSFRKKISNIKEDIIIHEYDTKTKAMDEYSKSQIYVKDIYDKGVEIVDSSNRTKKLVYSRMVTMKDGNVSFKTEDGWYDWDGKYKLISLQEAKDEPINTNDLNEKEESEVEKIE